LADDRVKQVKQANDIVDVVGGYLALRPAGATFKGLCPFHDDSRPSFDVDPRRQRYRCWACGKHGDVISFVQEFEKVSFPEALELLARRAGIELEAQGPAQGPGRAFLLDVMRWASKQFHDCLLDSDLAEGARQYLGERGLRGDVVRRWGLGYAPPGGQWLVRLATQNRVTFDLLQTVGLIAARDSGQGYYDRFRDRVLFPIRDVRGQTVGFGGRILPGSTDGPQGPKYYNSCDTPLFSKSQQLYGIDQARAAAEKAGYLAVVEGYTDVLMAHQVGICQVVATMGTALNERHVRQIRRFVPRVVLVFDADAGGDTGVERALELFASHDMDLAVATLPAGLDPCDLLVRDGPEPFRRVLESAVDALEFTLTRMVSREDTTTVEGSRRVVDAVLGVIALAPGLPGEAGTVKTQLMINRIARRLALREETVWARLDELRRARRGQHAPAAVAGGPDPQATPAGRSAAPAALEERQLLEVLLAEPALVARARAALPAEEIAHPGLRRLLEGLFALEAAGRPATLDELRAELDGTALLNAAFALQARGLDQPNREQCLTDLLAHFQRRRDKSLKQQLHSQLQATSDPALALELLRRLQNRSVDPGPGAGSPEDVAGTAPLSPSA
jgi:DNA primase